ncbi:MAG: DUF1501 domain-containing protein [Thaumarchaeota archaeon]|nr:DUF1501 domain-containing protein [Nitrososphaerota archaeon]
MVIETTKSNTTRRLFLKQVAQSVGAMPSLAPLSLGPTVIEATDAASGLLASAANRTLVVIQLMGGNDGINTLVPYSQQAYYQVRPTLGLKQSEILPIDGDVALNGNMGGIMGLYRNNNAAIVQGVSYPNPNRSHYEATAIWESAYPNTPLSNGWLGRYLDASRKIDNSITAVSLGDLLPMTLQGASSSAISVGSLQRFKVSPLTNKSGPADSAFKDLDSVQCVSCAEYNSLVSQMTQQGLDAMTASAIITQAASGYQAKVTYPNNDFANRLKLAAGIITSSLKPRIVYVTLGGFDTHANQRATQDKLLLTLSDGLAAFYNDLSSQGRANDTLMMTFSEFGRRVKENGSQGTDHGTALPQFIIGGRVSPGLYGTYPSLTDLEQGDLKFNVDFRQVYGTVLEDWLGIDQTTVLGSKYNKLSVV